MRIDCERIRPVIEELVARRAGGNEQMVESSPVQCSVGAQLQGAQVIGIKLGQQVGHGRRSGGEEAIVPQDVRREHDRRGMKHWPRY